MAIFKNYDPGKSVGTFGNVALVGLVKGTFVSAERNEDSYKIKEGGTGDVTRIRNRGKSGRVTVTMMAESPANDLLSAIVVADEKFGTGVQPLIWKDLLGNTLIHAANAWIVRPPKIEYGGDDSGDREWVFECDELIMFAGGSVV